MNSYENLLTWILLISTVTFSRTSSCLPGVIGTCGCCDSTRTTCIEIPYNILPFVTPNYMCISNEIIKTFSFTLCNCTLKDPALCLCFNRTQSFPIYEQCDSFTECAIADIRVKAKHEIDNTLCNRPIRTGRCSYRYTNRFYFDFHHNLCKEFMYSGCSANRKTFLTREFCEHTCQF
ncbi:unnamed protein product [Adineta steineri]|uniref:BPTI/Kunitz inhibitor domain-containing protein n=1 Tax=Adineta steineri TaxID=433720 RepID=A0A815DNR4_9BILA|nr:unnamed protein product [Adineta steineri]CAF1575522.1 unnamed protein product [Adineta steineri]